MRHGLKPSNLLLAPGEKAVLWFTTNDRWENTVFALDAPSLPEAYQKMSSLGGLARIGCDESIAPHRWKEIKEIASIPYHMAAHLYSSAIELGSRPGEWRGTLEGVPVDHFKQVEIYDGQKWICTSPSLKFAA
jgi:hypothetical protein